MYQSNLGSFHPLCLNNRWSWEPRILESSTHWITLIGLGRSFRWWARSRSCHHWMGLGFCQTNCRQRGKYYLFATLSKLGVASLRQFFMAKSRLGTWLRRLECPNYPRRFDFWVGFDGHRTQLCFLVSLCPKASLMMANWWRRTTKMTSKMSGTSQPFLAVWIRIDWLPTTILACTSDQDVMMDGIFPSKRILSWVHFSLCVGDK